MEEQLFKVLTFCAALFLGLASLTLFFIEFDATQRLMVGTESVNHKQQGVAETVVGTEGYSGEELICYITNHIGTKIAIGEEDFIVISENNMGSLFQNIPLMTTYKVTSYYDHGELNGIRIVEEVP